MSVGSLPASDLSERLEQESPCIHFRDSAQSRILFSLGWFLSVEVSWVLLGQGRLALSNRPKLKDIPKLADAGCQRIVTIQGRNELPGQIERAAKAVGLPWTWVPVGHGKAPDDEADMYLRRGLAVLVAAMEVGESVLVHCSAGIHRTGMLAFALLRWLGITESEALDIIATMRPVTREGVRAEHLAWGNQVAASAGRG
ncbi:MAG: tyrosine-protein phosphatase [Zavarzinella sp.]